MAKKRASKKKARAKTSASRKMVAVSCKQDLQYKGVHYEKGDAIKVPQQEVDQNPELFAVPVEKQPSATARHKASRAAAKAFAKHGSGRLRR